MIEAAARRIPRPTTVAALCIDRAASQPIRADATPAHLRWVEAMLAHIALAGPLYADDGSRMIGSLYVFRTDSLEQARAWLVTDPYYAAGFWEKIEFSAFLPAAGDLVGGTTW